VPFLAMQLVMVGVVLAFPQLVMVYKKDAPVLDPASVQVNIPTEAQPPPAEGTQAEDLMRDLMKGAGK